MFSRTKWIESIDRHRNYNTHYHTDDKVCFEWLLLRFMTEELLPNNRTVSPTDNPKHQQSGFRHSAPGFTCRRFIYTVDRQR